LSSELAEKAVAAQFNLEIKKATDAYRRAEKAYKAHNSGLERRLNLAMRRNRNLKENPWTDQEERTNKALLRKYIDTKAHLGNLQWEKQQIPIFHPKDSIYSIKVVDLKEQRSQKVVEKRNRRYYAWVKDQNEQEFVKEVSYVWLKDNLDKEYMEALEQHHNEKGWVCFDRNDQLAMVKNDDLLDLNNFRPVYSYKPSDRAARVLYVKALVQYSQENSTGDQQPPIEHFQWFVKTNRSGRDYVEMDRYSMDTIFGTEKFKSMKTTATWWALQDYTDISRGKKLREILVTVEQDGKKRNKIARFVDRSDWAYNETHLGKIEFPQVYYFNCRNDNYHLEVIERQISRIKYDTMKDKWFGIEREADPNDANAAPEIVALDFRWIRQNFSDAEIKQFQQRALNGTKKFLQVPVGDRIEVIPTMDTSMNPPIQFQNNESSICAFASLSSALYHLDYKTEANNLMDMIDGFGVGRESGVEMQFVIKSVFVDQNSAFEQLRFDFTASKLPRGFDILNAERNPLDIFFIVIQQSDNHASHAVAILGDFIFDCNTKFALPMTQEGLDCCCGSVATFDYVWFGYHIQRNQKFMGKKSILTSREMVHVCPLQTCFSIL